MVALIYLKPVGKRRDSRFLVFCFFFQEVESVTGRRRVVKKGVSAGR